MREKVKEIMEKSNKMIYENELYVRLKDVICVLSDEHEHLKHVCDGCFGAENNDCDSCQANVFKE